MRVPRERHGRGRAPVAEDVADGGEVRVEGADDVAHAVGLRGAERGSEAGLARVRLARVVVVVGVAVDVEVGAPTRGVAVRARRLRARHAEEHPEKTRDRAEKDAKPTRTMERRRHRATRRAGASAEARQRITTTRVGTRGRAKRHHTTRASRRTHTRVLPLCFTLPSYRNAFRREKSAGGKKIASTQQTRVCRVSTVTCQGHPRRIVLTCVRKKE